jgi:hypothetical protein
MELTMVSLLKLKKMWRFHLVVDVIIELQDREIQKLNGIRNFEGFVTDYVTH